VRCANAGLSGAGKLERQGQVALFERPADFHARSTSPSEKPVWKNPRTAGGRAHLGMQIQPGPDRGKGTFGRPAPKTSASVHSRWLGKKEERARDHPKRGGVGDSTSAWAALFRARGRRDRWAGTTDDGLIHRTRPPYGSVEGTWQKGSRPGSSSTGANGVRILGGGPRSPQFRSC